ncbi:MAG: hypothetical protein I8H68_01315 [Flavobacteriia bacterium]|nr:hypothetical protein [Flavobacteriia bacterium]MBH2024688.1 hypothetical protein [Flavobacteriales bacterium]
MSKKLVYLILLMCANFFFAQQNDEFRSAKDYFDYQRFMLNNEFKKKFDNEKNIDQKIAIKRDFSEFMVKLDSIQNTAFIGTLIKVKNREDLEKITVKNLPELHLNPKKEDLNKEAQYPGGFEMLRKQVADLFYTDSVLPDQKLLKANVVFVVGKDGSIGNVHAEGDNFTFNRQAEIAMYLLPEKFSPAIINGTAVRYRFRLPLSMTFD